MRLPADIHAYVQRMGGADFLRRLAGMAMLGDDGSRVLEVVLPPELLVRVESLGGPQYVNGLIQAALAAQCPDCGAVPGQPDVNHNCRTCGAH